MNARTANENRSTTTHELGHALGLAHSYGGQIMDSVPTSQITLGAHDQTDYHNLWGY